MKIFKSRIDVLNSVHSCGKILVGDEVILSKEQYTSEGKVLSRYVHKTVNPRDSLNKFKVSDFATENILAIGATDHFRPISSLPTADIDSALAAMDRIVDLADSVKSVDTDGGESSSTGSSSTESSSTES